MEQQQLSGIDASFLRAIPLPPHEAWRWSEHTRSTAEMDAKMSHCQALRVLGGSRRDCALLWRENGATAP